MSETTEIIQEHEPIKVVKYGGKTYTMTHGKAISVPVDVGKRLAMIDGIRQVEAKKTVEIPEPSKLPEKPSEQPAEKSGIIEKSKPRKGGRV